MTSRAKFKLRFTEDLFLKIHPYMLKDEQVPIDLMSNMSQHFLTLLSV